MVAEDGAAQSLKDPINYVTGNKQCLRSLLEILRNHTVSTCTCIYTMYIHLKPVVWVIEGWSQLQRHDYNYDYD